MLVSVFAYKNLYIVAICIVSLRLIFVHKDVFGISMYIVLDIMYISCYHMTILIDIKEKETYIMAYTTKRNIVSIIAGVGLIAAYIIYVVSHNSPAVQDVKAWATAILVFIGIGIGVQIIVQVLFHIGLSIGIAAREEIKGSKKSDDEVERIIKSEMVEDDYIKTIELKGLRIGYAFFGLGVTVAFVALALGAQMVVALHILFGMSAFSSVSEGVAGIILVEWGMR